MSFTIISGWNLFLCLTILELTPAIGGGYQLNIETVVVDAGGSSEVEGEIRQMFPALMKDR
ncbi:uncharacterized protein LOC108032853 [Drosophila biarmipes]|uniref:uncharacterized protein LOC108032853 n=1 Tax=Drosophila biarmipes TaxID=125945 RepID=UPI001CDA8761|nr:uncharacterized protein LOC108032853 [Drosophila biarmipes]